MSNGEKRTYRIVIEEIFEIGNVSDPWDEIKGDEGYQWQARRKAYIGLNIQLNRDKYHSFVNDIRSLFHSYRQQA